MKKIVSLFLSIIMISTSILCVDLSAFASDVDMNNRAQWLSQLAKTFEMNIDSDNYPDNYFSDLGKESEYYYDVLLAVEFGVVDIEAGDPVNPEGEITREFASQTLNFCLKFELENSDDENFEYTFTDYEQCEYPKDDQIAVNRGWFELDENSQFCPEQTVTSTEIDVMLTDAQETLKGDEVAENYDSTYAYEKDVLEVPSNTAVEFAEDNNIIIYDTSFSIKNGDTFVVYSNDIPLVYDAEEVTVNSDNITVKVTDTANENAVEDVDMQTVFDVAANDFIPADGYEIVEEPVPVSALRKAKAAKNSIKLSKKIDTIAGNSINIEIKISDITLSKKIKTADKSLTVKADFNLSVNINGQFNLTDIGKDDLADLNHLGSIPVAGIGYIDFKPELNFSGKVGYEQKYNITLGFTKNNSGLHNISSFNKEKFNFVFEASCKFGLKVEIGLKILTAKVGVYAEIGVMAKATAETSENADKVSTYCLSLNAYMYVNLGAEYNINIGFWKNNGKIEWQIYKETNSPVRLYFHFENGKSVDACTVGSKTKTKYVTPTTSQYGSVYEDNISNESNIISVGDFEISTNSDGTATITQYTGAAKNVTVPEYINGYKITALQGYSNGIWSTHWGAFQLCDVDTVTLPCSINYIGSRALSGCKYIIVDKSNANFASENGVLFNKNKTELIQYPIGNTRTSYSIPDSVNSICYRAFAGCISLTSITIGNSVTNIGGEAFLNCSSLSSVIIPDSVAIIGNSAFSNCENLINITIPNSVTSINTSAFSNCKSLTSITIPDSVNKIGGGVFYNCTSLTSVNLGKNITTLDYKESDVAGTSGDGFFENCKSLTDIILPNNIVSIGDEAFKTTGLTSIIIPDSVNEIGDSVFCGCSKLKSVVLCENIKILGERYDCGFFEACTSLTSITIPNSVTSIDDRAFSGCTSLISITIPNSITNIGEDVFCNCVSLKEISVDTNNEHYLSKDGVLFNKSKTALIQYPAGSDRTSYIVPDGITTISETAFFGCNNLTHITVSDSVTTIQSKAFYTCINLTSITIGNSVTSIGKDAFYYCNKLSKTNFTGTIAQWAQISFAPDYDYYDATTYANPIRYSKNLYINDELAEDIEINNITEIKARTFLNCKSLKSVKISDNVTNIGVQAFSNCTGITDITISKSVISIGTYAFVSCTSLKNIIIQSLNVSLESRGDKSDPFTSCYQITDVFYIGTQDDWKHIDGNCCYNSGLKKAKKIHYNATENHYQFEKTVEPTCTNKGYDVYKCVCGFTYTESINELDHNLEFFETVNPTCTSRGYTTYKCTICNNMYNSNYIDATGHSYTAESTEPTCTAQGYTEYICTTCGNTYRDSFIESIGHNYINGICENCDDDRNIYLDIEKTAVINSDSECVYFEFTPNKTGTYTFSSMSESDTYGYIYDENMNELASDDDSGDDRNFSVKYKLQANTKYIFGCRYYSNNKGEFNVVVTKNIEIKYIPISPIEIIENTNGSWETNDNGNKFYYYSYPWSFNQGDVLSVTDRNGKSVDYTFNNHEYYGFVSEEGNVIAADLVSSYSDQYSNPWTVNGENYITIEYLGAEAQIPVTITENPVESVEYIQNEPYEIMENTCGYWYEIDGDTYYNYDYNPKNDTTVILHYKDGTEKIFNDFYSDDGEYLSGCSWLDYPEYQENLHWYVGNTYQYKITIYGYECIGNVTIIENTHVHQYITEVHEPTCSQDGYTYYYCEGCGDSYNSDYIDSTGVHTYVNGFCKYCHTKDNDYTLPTISVGETKNVNIENGGDYCYFSFTPKTDGNYIFSSNSETDTYGYLYDADMNELTSDDDSGRNNNFSISYDFEAGKTYIFGCRFYSNENIGSFDVSLDENTVKSIEFTSAKPYEIIENTHGRWCEYWYHENGNELYKEYWCYDIPSYQNGDVLTVTDKDGSSVDYVFNDNEYNFSSEDGNVIDANSVNCYSNQYANPWTIDEENYLTIEYMGATVQVPVTIIENPVDSIEYAPVNGFVNAEGITYAPGDGGTWHFRDGYIQSGDKLTVNYKNTGTKEYFAVFNNQGFYEFVTENNEKLDENANFYLDENYGDEWDDVTSISVNCYGKNVELPITTKITIETIEFMPVNPVTIIESNGHEDNRQTWTDDAGNVTYGTNVYWGQDENGETTIESEIFNIGDVINVIYSNGQSASYTYYANRSFEYGYGFIGDAGSVLYVGDIRSNQNEQPWTVDGDNYFTINFSQAVTEKIPVTIIKNIDTDTLIAAIEKFNELNSADYSETSYNNLKNVVDNHKSLLDSAQSQEDVDRAVIEILEAIYDLEPYFNFTVSSENGSYEVTCDGSTSSDNKYSLLFGTEITLSATANEGYEFVGWYDVTNNLYFSKESTYTFKITSNTNLKAVCAKKQSATLTFTTYSNWVQSAVTKTVDEWNGITSIDDLLPEVPYKYGYINGRWVYDNNEVLAKLRAGEGVFLIPEYDEDDTSLPTPREPENGEPALDLYYKLDADTNVGSFVMAAGIPDNCRIESVGIAFYYKKANEFDPTKFELLINNKMLVSRFNTEEIEDIYIVNMNKLTSTYNWAVRGYVTYYDADGNLKTAYSNQVNIVNREQV